MNNDLISRSKAIEELNYLKYIGCDNSGVMKLQNMEIQRCISVIEDAPAVETVSLEHHNKIKGILDNEIKSLVDILDKERPQGEWITVHFRPEELNVPQKASMFDFVKCPFCKTIHQGRHNFCSRCGADMRKGGAE